MKYGNRVKQYATCTGTSNPFTLTSIYTRYLPFSGIFSTGDMVQYTAVYGELWEIGEGAFNASNGTIDRTHIFASSSNADPVNWQAGTQITVFNAVNADTISRIATLGPTVYIAGVLEVSTGNMPYIMPVDGFFTAYSAAVGTAASGDDINFTIKKNGNTLFTGSILDGQSTRAKTTISASIDAGDILTLNIDSVGSTMAGSNLSVRLYF